MPASDSKSKRPLWAMGIVALVFAFSTVYLVHYYGESRPMAAQVQTGHIHPAKIHDRTVYLTTGEYALAFTTHVVAIVAIGVFIGIAVRFMRKAHAGERDA